jgi:hypothetical protein
LTPDNALVPSSIFVTLEKQLDRVVAHLADIVENARAHRRPAADKIALERALCAAEAEWRKALDRLAEAERRLFSMYPLPPNEIVIPGSDDSSDRAVPASWSALRRHLRRVHRHDPALRSRLAATHAKWTDYHATRDRLADADWFREAQAAEESAAASVEVLHRRIAVVLAQTWAGLRVVFPAGPILGVAPCSDNAR